MKKRKYLIVIMGSILFAGLFIFNAKPINAKQTIYDKIDVLVATNKGKAETLYKVLGELKDYVGKKLGKKEQTVIRGGLDLTNVYGFDISNIDLKDYEVKLFDKRMAGAWLNEDELYIIDDYYLGSPYVQLYKGNPIIFINGEDNLRIVKGNYQLLDAVKMKYKNIIDGKLSLKSDDFEKIYYYIQDKKELQEIIKAFSQNELKNRLIKNDKGEIVGWYDYSVFDDVGGAGQRYPMNQHFIKDNQGNIKGIGLYVFEGNGDVGSMGLKYKIYSLKGESMMIINVLISNQWDKELVIKNNDGSEKIDTDKFKNKYFKDGYFNDGIKSKEYWQEMKNKIDSYEELVKSS